MTTVKVLHQRAVKWYQEAEQGYSLRNTIWECRITTVKESLKYKKALSDRMSAQGYPGTQSFGGMAENGRSSSSI